MTAAPNYVTDLPVLPLRAPATHKHRQGRISIVGGNTGMAGAALLAGLGALRGGAGLVRLSCSRDTRLAVNAFEPAIMTHDVMENETGNFDDPVGFGHEWADVLAIGPGLATTHPLRLIQEFARIQKPQVWDAGMLGLLAAQSREIHKGIGKARESAATIVTPHEGEMSRLLASAGLPACNPGDEQSRISSAIEYAGFSAMTVVLKGHRTVVSDGIRIFVNTTGNPGMATGGMGDVLTGLIAALVGQGLDAFDAACLGVHVHGAAADRLARNIGSIGFLAREVADALPASMAEASRPKVGFC